MFLVGVVADGIAVGLAVDREVGEPGGIQELLVIGSAVGGDGLAHTLAAHLAGDVDDRGGWVVGIGPDDVGVSGVPVRQVGRGLLRAGRRGIPVHA